MLNDLHLAFRLLRRSPGFTAIAVLTLALGIGANTAIFSVVHRVVFDPLQVEAPEALVTMHWQSESGRLSSGSLFGDYVVWRDEAAAFAGVAAEGRLFVALGSDAATEQVTALVVSAGYADLLGVPPQAGRWFLPGDDMRDAEPVAVLSDRLWRRRFNADPRIIGRSVRITGVPSIVVGVAPAGFGGTDLRQPADLFLPLMVTPAIAPVQENFFGDVEENGFSPSAWLRVVARLDAGVGLDGAQVEADAVGRRRRETLGHRDPPRVRLIPAARAAVPLGTRGETIRFAALLAAARVAMSLVPLIGAGLFAHSLQNALGSDLGFDPNGLVAARLSPSLARYDGDRAARMFAALRDRVAGLPGVVSATVGGAPVIDFVMSTPSLDADGETVQVGEPVQINPWRGNRPMLLHAECAEACRPRRQPSIPSEAAPHTGASALHSTV